MNSIKLWSVKEECLKHKWIFLINCAIAILIAWLFSYAIPTSYDVQCKISIDASEDKLLKNADLFSKITTKLGVKEESLVTDPWLYRNILESPNFQQQLGTIIVTTETGKQPKTFAEYLQQDYKQPWWTRWVGKEDLSELIDDNIRTSVDMHNGIITIQTSAQDPNIAFSMLDSVCHRLQAYLTDYSRKKAEIELENTRKRLARSKEKYKKAMKEYAEFVDCHTDISEPSAQVEANSLQQKFDKALAAYNKGILQHNMAEMRLSRIKPYFFTLVNEMKPLQPSHPKLFVNIFIWVFYTFWTTFWFILIRHKIQLKKKGQTDEIRR